MGSQERNISPLINPTQQIESETKFSKINDGNGLQQHVLASEHYEVNMVNQDNNIFSLVKPTQQVDSETKFTESDY